MQLRECEYILAIAEEGNMGKAAQRLYTSQPTLSKMLGKLEEKIGMPLFERQPTGMVPTAAGAVYIDGARKMLELNAQWEKDIDTVTGKLPVLDVGFPMIRLDILACRVVPALAARYPGLQSVYICTSQSRIATDLLNNKCAIGVGIITEQYASLLNYETVGEEEYVLAVPKGHPLERKAHPLPGSRFPHLAVSHLKNTPFVLSRPGAYSTRVAQRFFEDHGITPPIALTMQNTGNIMKAVAYGTGVALLPSQPLDAIGMKDKLTYLHVDTREEPMQIGVLYRRGHVLNRIELALAEELHEAYRMK